MFYAFVDFRGECESFLHLFSGSLENIADAILDNDSLLMEEAEAEDLYDVDSYEILSQSVSDNIIRNYYTEIGGSSTRVLCLVESYDELIPVFDSFKKGTYFDGYSLTKEEHETELIDAELQKITDCDADLKCFIFDN